MSRQALIVVLGDLGRSPRMVNHARALLARGWEVTLAGYDETAVPPDVAAHPFAHIAALRPGWRALWQLGWHVARRGWTAVVIQNPPGFPALAVTALTRAGETRLVLDWHNLGSTLLALRPTGRRRWARLYAWCERAAARCADDQWSVSSALAAAVGSPAAPVIYDQPSRAFCAAAVVTEDRRAWWRRMLPGQPLPLAERWVAVPSSWGPDEDQRALLRVAWHYQSHPHEWSDTPTMALIATGKGPGQAEFAAAAVTAARGPVSVQTVWLSPEAYPAFLAHADLGVCLHRSSSGWDLPMKLADFRGANLPHLVADYGPVLAEILTDTPQIRRFRSDDELGQALRELARLERRADSVAPQPTLWETEWDRKLGRWAAALEAERPAI